MNGIIRGLATVNAVQLWALRWGAIAMVLVIAVVIAAGVFFRYVLNDSLSWSEELAKYAMLWMVFLGAPIALKFGVHPNIEIVIERFPQPIVRLIRVIVYAAVFCFCAFLALKSHAFAWNGRTQVAIAIGDVSMYWFFLSIPVGMASMALVSLQQFMESLVMLFSGRQVEEDGFNRRYKAVLDEF